MQNRLDSGEDFGAVAMNFSEDPNTSPEGGDMGFVAESALQSEPEVFNAISKLKPGEITGILPTTAAVPEQPESPIGFAIYKLIGR